MGYRSTKSYHAKSEAAKRRQLRGLKIGRKHRTKAISTQHQPSTNPFDCAYKNDPVRYLEDHFFIPETRQPIRLERWQKVRIIRPLFSLDRRTGKRKYTLALIGLPKKNGKSTLAAGIVNFFLFQGEPFGEIILAANSRDQSSWVIFEKLKRSLQMNRNQFGQVKITEDSVEVKKTGTVARIVGLNYKTASGANPSLVIFDELWAFEDTASGNPRKFYDELTTVPTREQPLTLIVTYAGFDEESLLHDLYKQGLARKDAKQFFYWTHRNRASWVTQEYLDTQRARLRPNTYLRLHENRWTASEEAFINIAEWDACVDANYLPALANKSTSIIVGVDIGIKSDTSAVVSVQRKDDKIILIRHRKWMPTAKEPLDIEESVERYILELNKKFRILEVRYDPFQFHRSAMTLQKAGVTMTEFPQSQSNTICMSQCLYELVKGGNLVLYRSEEMRIHAGNCRALESPRGFRIVKGKRSEKIDLIIALAIAAYGAIETKGGGEVFVGMEDDEWNPWPDEMGRGSPTRPSRSEREGYRLRRTVGVSETVLTTDDLTNEDIARRD